MSKIFNILSFAVIFVAVDFREAHAYLDPGTGSYVFQMTIAFLLVAFVALKNFWLRILYSIKKLIGIEKEKVEDSHASFKDE